MRTHAFRLHRGDDLRLSLQRYAAEHCIGAAVILSCVGCVSQARLRDATGVRVQEVSRHGEIVSATGTVSMHGLHVHIALSMDDLSTVGGHLAEGCIINTTAEIVLLEMEDLRFTREYDPQTGYDELVITPLSCPASYDLRQGAARE